jgi:hypothetical protein
MSAVEIISDIERAGVRLVLVGEKLKARYDQPGMYTDAMRQAVAENRPAIIALLSPVSVELEHTVGVATTTVAITTPVEHLQSLGGYGPLAEQYGIECAHRLWDSARLWERDREDARLAVRWSRQYETTWALALQSDPLFKGSLCETMLSAVQSEVNHG